MQESQSKVSAKLLPYLQDGVHLWSIKLPNVAALALDPPVIRRQVGSGV
jgi:hypothetical protein